MSKAQVIREYLDRFKTVSNLGVAKKLHHDHPELFTDIDGVRAYIQRIKGKCGTHSLKDTTRHESAPHGTKPFRLPPSKDEPWKPVRIKGVTNLGVISDIHIPFHSKIALQAAIKHMQYNGVDGILIDGDAIDFPLLSRFNKDPRTRKTKKDVQALADFLNMLNDVFPNIPKWFKEGNHEERWSIYIWNNAPILWDFEHLRLENAIGLQMGNKDLTMPGWTYIDEGRPVMAGDLAILHGHELPKGLTNPVNMARGAFLRAGRTVLVGHGHRSSTHPEPDMFKNEVVCWSIGCLCGLTPKWMRVNKWNYGFATIAISGKKFDVDNLRISRTGNIRSS